MAASLDTRQAGILSVLLESKDNVAASQLAARLGISARSIRYNLRLLESWLALRGARLTSSPRLGTSLDAPDEVRASLLEEIKKGHAVPRFKLEDRPDALLFELLSSPTYLTASQLQQCISVSRGTLAQALSLARPWLLEHQLDLDRRPRLGTAVIGEEIRIRQALIALLLKLELGNEILDVCLWGTRRHTMGVATRPPIQQAIMSKVATWGLPDNWRYVGRLESDLGVTFADEDHLYLALCCALMVRRTQQGCRVRMPHPQDQSHIQSQPEFRAVGNLATRLRSEIGLQLEQAEILYLTLELLTLPREGEVLDDQPFEAASVTGKSLFRAVCLLAEAVREQIGCGPADPAVLGRMTRHLARAAARLQNELPIRNAYAGDVSSLYGEICAATQLAVRQIERTLGISFPMEEVAFLAMYLALAFDLPLRCSTRPRPRVLVVCPSGGVTVSMLLSRLHTELPELDVVRVASMRSLARLNGDDVDAVISTAPAVVRGLPSIVVSPLLPGHDLTQIRRVLRLLRR